MKKYIKPTTDSVRHTAQLLVSVSNDSYNEAGSGRAKSTRSDDANIWTEAGNNKSAW